MSFIHTVFCLRRAFCFEIKFSLFKVHQLFIMPKLYCRQPFIATATQHFIHCTFGGAGCVHSTSVRPCISHSTCKRNLAVSKFSENGPCSIVVIPHVQPFSFPLSSTSKFKYVCNFSLNTLWEIIVISSGSPTKLSTHLYAYTSTSYLTSPLSTR